MTPQEFKEARISLGLTLKDLAEILNTSVRTIQKWEANGGANARAPNPIACQVLRWLESGQLVLD